MVPTCTLWLLLLLAALAGALVVPLQRGTPLTGCALEFYASVGLGNQTFRLLIDSGSATLAVASTACTNCGDAVQPRFPAPSPGGETTEGYYIDESGWTADVAPANVSFASLAQPVPLQIAAIVSQTNGFFVAPQDCALYGDDTTSPYEGILGLGPAALAAVGTQPFVVQAVAQGAMSNYWSVQLCPANGTLWLGADNQPVLGAGAGADAVVWTPMIDTDLSFYIVQPTALLVNGTDVMNHTHTPRGLAALLDTGTDVGFLPSRVYASLSAQLNAHPALVAAFGPDSELYGPPATGSCVPPRPGWSVERLNRELPSLTLRLLNGSAPVTLLPVGSYLLQLRDGGGNLYYCSGLYPTSDLAEYFSYSSSSSSSASASYYELLEEDELAVFGWPLLSQHWIVLDLDAQQVGFGPALCGINTTRLSNGTGERFVWQTLPPGACTRSPASARCGLQTRIVRCVSALTGVATADERCTSTRPATSQTCGCRRTVVRAAAARSSRVDAWLTCALALFAAAAVAHVAHGRERF